MRHTTFGWLLVGAVLLAPLGLDGIPHLSFAFDYDKIVHTRCYKFLLSVSGSDINVELSVRTGLTQATFPGHRALIE